MGIPNTEVLKLKAWPPGIPSNLRVPKTDVTAKMATREELLVIGSMPRKRKTKYAKDVEDI